MGRDPQYYAVITGDIVDSTKLPNDVFKQVQAILKQGGDDTRDEFGVPHPPEMFRGDSWQLLVPDPGKALRVALYMRTYLRSRAPSKSVDTRLAIGVGAIDFRAGEATSIGEARGEAFRVSGALLDDKQLSTRLRFGHAAENDVPSGMRFDIVERDTLDGWWEVRSISVIVRLIDFLVTGWTKAQARAVCGALLNWKQQRIAKEWSGEPITQQAVAQHLDRAGWAPVSDAVEYYERIMSNWHPQ